jgi:hypothetical protein
MLTKKVSGTCMRVRSSHSRGHWFATSTALRGNQQRTPPPGGVRASGAVQRPTRERLLLLVRGAADSGRRATPPTDGSWGPPPAWPLPPERSSRSRR